MGLMYARNAVNLKWMAETKLYLFGPSEVVVVTDPALRDLLPVLVDEGTAPTACKYSARTSIR